MPSRKFIVSLGVLLSAAGVVLLPAQAQDRKIGPGQAKHIVYVVKLGSAKDIAAVLSRQFQGDAEVDALPEPNGNCLLIRTNPQVFDEVIKTLQALDRRPRLVSVEVWVAEVVAPKATEKGEEPKLAPIDDKALNGPSGVVLIKLREMQRNGQIASLKRLQTAVAENQSAYILEGGHTPVVVGSMVRATGIASQTITYRNTGTSVRCTPRVADDQTVMLELKVDDSRVHIPEDGAVIGEGEKGKIRAAQFPVASYTGTVSIAPGRAVLLREVKVDEKAAGPNRTIFLATARVIDETAKPGDTAQPGDDEPLPPRRPRPGGRGGLPGAAIRCRAAQGAAIRTLRSRETVRPASSAVIPPKLP